MSESIGQKLRDARTQKGLTIEQISQLTHIKIRFLEAMENDQFETIPSVVQLKGFLRLYAAQVGLPFQPLIDIVSGKEAGVESQNLEPVPPTKSTAENHTLFKPGNKIPDILSRAATFLPSRNNKAVPAMDAAISTPRAQSADTFLEIGQTIRTRREALGLTLPDIEDYIHVRAYYLKLIEDGNVQDLPSLVQARGMLNNYLNFLDLNADEIMLLFADGLQQIHFEKTGTRPTPQKTTPKNRVLSTGWRRFLTTDLILGSIVILVIVGLAIWGGFQLSSLPENQPKTGSGSISDRLMQTSPTITGTVPVNNSRLGPVEKLASGQTGDQPTSEPTSTLVFNGGGPIQIYVVSNQRAYMRVIVDGKTVFDGRVLPGNAYPYSGNQEIELLAGNAGAFKVSYLLNGTQNDMGALGSNGEVKSLIFTNQGIVTPTPRFTVTATATPLSSITPTPQISITPQKATITPFIPQ
jgi:cytoskeleton protein RodZ